MFLGKTWTMSTLVESLHESKQRKRPKRQNVVSV